MEKALEFYRDLLGLKIQGTTDEKGDFISQLLSNENIEVKTVKLSADDNATRIELLQFFSPKSNQNEKIGLLRPGFTHVALTVSNLDETYSRLRENNVQFNCPPTISPNGKLKVTFCRDFEGNHLELIEEI